MQTIHLFNECTVSLCHDQTDENIARNVYDDQSASIDAMQTRPKSRKRNHISRLDGMQILARQSARTQIRSIANCIKTTNICEAKRSLCAHEDGVGRLRANVDLRLLGPSVRLCILVGKVHEH